MSDPWDRPPVPLTGDLDDETTYAGIGRVVSEWEEVEVALAELHSLFIGKYLRRPGIREYGDGSTSSTRIRKLCSAAERFFQKWPSQAFEKDFENVVNRVQNYAARRHDVARGVVRAIQFTRMPHSHNKDDFPHYCVVPPDYNYKNFSHSNLPMYLYTRAEMDIIQAAMDGAYHEVISFTIRLSKATNIA